MPSLLWFALLAFMLADIALPTEVQADVKRTCPEFGRPCDCAWHVRDCLPSCHIRPRLECADLARGYILSGSDETAFVRILSTEHPRTAPASIGT